MELGTKSLSDEIKTRRKITDYFSNEKILDFMKIFITEFAKLEKIHINHGDIKPGNFLLVKNKWKICDFGCS